MPRKTAFLTVLLAVTTASAQESAPSGFLRGDFLSWAGTPRSGQFLFRAAENHVYFCSYDDKTYFEREKLRATIASAEAGDRLEVVSDRKQGSTACYARTVHILDVQSNHMLPGVRPRPRPAAPAPELFGPRGNLTFSGSVYRVTENFLTLRSRSGDHQTIRLRPDTRFSAAGQAAEPGSLRANTLVFVRAGKNLDGEVEAYQVVWGEIFHPEE
jgi:hypothetical protein